MDAVLFGLANPMFGQAPTRPPTSPGRSRPSFLPHRQGQSAACRWPAIRTASRPRFHSTSLPGVNEPLCVLVQESLGQIGIKTTINKVPGANWRTELTEGTARSTQRVSGWLDYPDTSLLVYHGNNSIFNTMSYKSRRWTD